MQQRMMDRWIEAAEARRVCERAIGEQIQVHPVGPTPQPLSMLTKLRTKLRLDAAHQRPAFVQRRGLRPSEAPTRLSALSVG